MAALPLLVLLFVARASAAEGIYTPLELKENEQQLMASSNQMEELFVRRGYRYEDAKLTDLIERLGAQLAPAPTDSYIKYRFHVLRDIEPNAFALPDGQVYLNTGMLALLENEAQLAGLLGHEVNHSAGHHAILGYRSVRRKVVTSMVLGPLTLGIGDIFIALSVYGFSRDLEQEADQRGAQRMVALGYDPSQMARLFEIMLEDPEAEEPRRATAWSTHPDLKARIEYTKAQAPSLTSGMDPSALQINAAGFRPLVRRVALDTVHDMVAADRPRSAVVLAGRLVEEDPNDAARHLALADAHRSLGARSLKPLSIVRGPPEVGDEDEPKGLEREKKRNIRERERLTREEREKARLATPEGRENLRVNMESARASYQRTLAIDPSMAEAHRSLGFVHEALGDLKQAGIEFVAYLRARAEAPDKAQVLEHLKQINEKLKKGGTVP